MFRYTYIINILQNNCPIYGNNNQSLSICKDPMINFKKYQSMELLSLQAMKISSPDNEKMILQKL